jgi:hypothetical protein
MNRRLGIKNRRKDLDELLQLLFSNRGQDNQAVKTDMLDAFIIESIKERERRREERRPLLRLPVYIDDEKDDRSGGGEGKKDEEMEKVAVIDIS